jgi:hypothetical protein
LSERRRCVLALEQRGDNGPDGGAHGLEKVNLEIEGNERIEHANAECGSDDLGLARIF